MFRPGSEFRGGDGLWTGSGPGSCPPRHVAAAELRRDRNSQRQTPKWHFSNQATSTWQHRAALRSGRRRCFINPAVDELSAVAVLTVPQQTLSQFSRPAAFLLRQYCNRGAKIGTEHSKQSRTAGKGKRLPPPIPHFRRQAGAMAVWALS